MPRMRGPVGIKPDGPDAWPLLNVELFGDNAIGGHDVTVRPEALPWSWPRVFGREAPRTLEIGFNRGKFLRAIAAAWPDHDHIGVEIRRRYVWRLSHDLAAQPEAPRNLRLIWADAKRVTAALFPPGGLQAIFVNFPDPWWKKRHVKRRLVQPDYAQALARMLAPEGRVWVKSDVPAIAAEIDAALAGTGLLGDRRPFGPDDLPATHREAHCVSQGMEIARFSYARLR